MSDDVEKMSPELESEYDASFSGEDKIVNLVAGIRSDVKIEKSVINIEDIIISEFKKLSRSDTLIGLGGIISQWGVVNPIHVLKLEDEDSYMLLDGARRLFGAIRKKETTITAFVWDFEDKDEGKSKANIIGLILNRSQMFSAKEQWGMLQILETANMLTPGTIEFLLCLPLGNAMKLKDVFLADSEYSEIREALERGELTIESAYRKLMSERKKEDRLAKDEMRTLEVDGSGELVASQKMRLSVDEVIDILEMSDTTNDASLDQLDRTNEIRGITVQDVGDRKPVDRRIKQAVFMRDGYRCRCCGIGGGAHWLAVLVYHHLVPVSAGGVDSIENGLSICQNCHMSLHEYVVGNLIIDKSALSESDKVIFSNIFKYGNIAITAYKAIGAKTREDIKLKDGDAATRHAFPGENLKENTDLFMASKSVQGAV